jgi:hypothetical protein
MFTARPLVWKRESCWRVEVRTAFEISKYVFEAVPDRKWLDEASLKHY